MKRALYIATVCFALGFVGYLLIDQRSQSLFARPHMTSEGWKG